MKKIILLQMRIDAVTLNTIFPNELKISLRN